MQQVMIINIWSIFYLYKVQLNQEIYSSLFVFPDTSFLKYFAKSGNTGTEIKQQEMEINWNAE